MTEYLNLFVLLTIIGLLIKSFFDKSKMVSCIFLIGFTQIGDIYPVLGEMRIEYILGILAIILLFPNGLKNIFSLESHINKYFILFVIVTILSIPFAFSPSLAVEWFIYYFKRCFVYYFLIVVLLGSEDKIKSFIWIYIIAIVWLAAHAFTNFIFHNNVVLVDGVDRVRGATNILSNPNGLANTIVQTLPLIYYMAISENNKLKQIMLVLIGVLGFIVVFMTGSRGGFIGLVFTFMILCAFSKNKTRAMGFSLAILITCLIVIGPDMLMRYKSILDVSGYDVTGESRIWGLIHGISMAVKRPILGTGIGCYEIARAEWFHWRLWPHNTFGQLIGELGILGTFAWSLLVYHTVKSARQVRNFIKEKLPNEYTFLYYLMLGIELSTYVRLVLGMTTHSLHIFFWYVNAALVVAVGNVVYSEQLSDQKDTGLISGEIRSIKA